MNYIDIVILLFLLYGAFRGFSKGLIIEVATLAGLILGFSLPYVTALLPKGY